MKTTLGQNIYTLRKRKKLTQQKLADKVGTTKSHICIVETKDIDFSYKLLHRLSKALGKSMNALIERPIDAKPD